ncbi:unnamed protein product [Caenorhabditis brenneri]
MSTESGKKRGGGDKSNEIPSKRMVPEVSSGVESTIRVFVYSESFLCSEEELSNNSTYLQKLFNSSDFKRKMEYEEERWTTLPTTVEEDEFEKFLKIIRGEDVVTGERTDKYFQVYSFFPDDTVVDMLALAKSLESTTLEMKCIRYLANDTSFSLRQQFEWAETFHAKKLMVQVCASIKDAYELDKVVPKNLDSVCNTTKAIIMQRSLELLGIRRTSYPLLPKNVIIYGPTNSDIRIIAERKQFKCLKKELSNHSMYYQKLFNSKCFKKRKDQGWAEPPAMADPDTFEKFLKIIRGADIVTDDTVVKLLELAESLESTTLEMSCVRHLANDTSFSLKRQFEMAEKYHSKTLMIQVCASIQDAYELRNVVPKDLDSFCDTTKKIIMQRSFELLGIRKPPSPSVSENDVIPQKMVPEVLQVPISDSYDIVIAGDRQRFECSKKELSNHSMYFQNMFNSSEFKERKNKRWAELPAMADGDTFGMFLKTIRGEDIITDDTVVKLLELAESLESTTLEINCIRHLANNTSFSLRKQFEMAEKYNSEKLMKQVFASIKDADELDEVVPEDFDSFCNTTKNIIMERSLELLGIHKAKLRPHSSLKTI